MTEVVIKIKGISTSPFFIFFFFLLIFFLSDDNARGNMMSRGPRVI